MTSSNDDISRMYMYCHIIPPITQLCEENHLLAAGFDLLPTYMVYQAGIKKAGNTGIFKEIEG